MYTIIKGAENKKVFWIEIPEHKEEECRETILKIAADHNAIRLVDDQTHPEGL